MSKAQDFSDTIEWLKDQTNDSVLLEGEHKKYVIEYLSESILKAYGMSGINSVSGNEVKELLSDFVVNQNRKSCEAMQFIIRELYPQHLEMINKLLLLK
jgi:hypothetical protein